MRHENKRVLLESAYLLHRRPFRETSFLIELFTESYGCFTAIARGVRNKKYGSQALLQPFQPLVVSWSGKSDLVTLTHFEAECLRFSLQGEFLFAGFYVNELLVHLLQKWDAHSNLYYIYQATLQALSDEQPLAFCLRRFEKKILEEIGYGFLPKPEEAKKMFIEDGYYRFLPEQGFVKTTDDITENPYIFSGKSLLAIANEAWNNETILFDAKRLVRLIMTPLLGNKTLNSRHLFMHLAKKEK